MRSERWHVHQIDDDETFRALRGEWTELLRHSHGDTLFLSWEWLYSWWRHLGGGRELAILAVRDGGTLVGLAPLMRRRRGLLPSLEFLGTGSVGSDYLDVIARRGFEGCVVTALADELGAAGRPLLLRGVRGGDSAAAALASRLDEGGWSHTSTTANTCPYIDLGDHDWDSYLATLSSSHRYNFRRRRRQMEREYSLSFEQAEGPEECSAALEILIELHRKRWRERGGSDALHRSTLLDFHREFAARARERGWLRLFVLRLDGRPAAALYGFRYRDRFLFYQSGFDPEFAKHSPSLVTLGMTIRSAIDDGATEYDLLHGDERYKFHWASRQRSLERIECHPPGLAASLVRNGRRLSARSKSLARQLLPAPVLTVLSDIRERVS